MSKPARKKFDWVQVLRAVGWLSVIISLGGLLFSVVGIAGHFTMALLDTIMGANLTNREPWVMWAITGALIGIGPALWSMRSLNQRRLVVLIVPIVVMATIGAVSTIAMR